MRGVTLNGVRRRIRRLISTRTPHAGSDACAIDLRKDINRFQPALPMRGVTVQLASAVAHGFISTRTPHAGSDGEFAVGALDRFIISTRTPHAGSDSA